VLARMRRPERQRTIRERVARVREVVPDLAIRTTCIVGFPGETEDDVRQLLDFLEETQFERVGVFTYSPQEGTRAAAMEDDVPEVVKRERQERVTELQRAITAERYERLVGRSVRAMVDRPAGAGEPAQARLVCQADDIDGITRIATDAPAGALLDVRVDEVVDDYDFEATVERVVDAPATLAPATRRVLPMLATTIGSFGR
jgi:ribosomal protein S12 methylthiotransferase